MVKYKQLQRLFLQPDQVIVCDIYGVRWLTDRFVIVRPDVFGMDHLVNDLDAGFWRIRSTMPPVPAARSWNYGQKIHESLRNNANPEGGWEELRDTRWATQRPDYIRGGDCDYFHVLLPELGAPTYINCDLFAGWRDVLTEGECWLARQRGADTMPVKVTVAPWLDTKIVAGYIMPLRVSGGVYEPPTLPPPHEEDLSMPDPDIDAHRVEKNGRAHPETVTHYSEHEPAIKPEKTRRRNGGKRSSKAKTEIKVRPDVMADAKAQLVPGTKLQIVDEETVLIVNDSKPLPAVPGWR